jgi:hypothetical protein
MPETKRPPRHLIREPTPQATGQKPQSATPVGFRWRSRFVPSHAVERRPVHRQLARAACPCSVAAAVTEARLMADEDRTGAEVVPVRAMGGRQNEHRPAVDCTSLPNVAHTMEFRRARAPAGATSRAGLRVRDWTPYHRAARGPTRPKVVGGAGSHEVWLWAKSRDSLIIRRYGTPLTRNCAHAQNSSPPVRSEHPSRVTGERPGVLLVGPGAAGHPDHRQRIGRETDRARRAR